MPTAREKLRELCGTERVRIAWLGMPTPVSARLAAEAGFDLAVIDREHGAIGVETAASMVFALGAEAAGAMVRVPDHGRAGIQQALDAGADGLVFPKVDSAEDARELVQAALYPPLGSRGAASAVIGATGYGTDTGYQAAWNDRALLAMQIETRASLAAAADIARVEGVDMLFFGPFDYAADAGLDPASDGAALSEAFAGVVAAARGAERLVGVFPWPGQSAKELFSAGADAVAAASDIVALRKGLEAALAAR